MENYLLSWQKYVQLWAQLSRIKRLFAFSQFCAIQIHLENKVPWGPWGKLEGALYHINFRTEWTAYPTLHCLDALRPDGMGSGTETESSELNLQLLFLQILQYQQDINNIIYSDYKKFSLPWMFSFPFLFIAFINVIIVNIFFSRELTQRNAC